MFIGKRQESYFYSDDDPQPLCCLEGCVTGTVVVFLFLFVIPAGVIVSVYASNADSDSILAVGILLIVTPIVCVPIVIAIIFNRRRLRKLRKNKVIDSSYNPVEKY